MLHDRLIMLYGALPEPLYLLQFPDKGVRWKVLMQAVRRLVKRITNTPRHKAAPYWNVEGFDEPLKDPTKYLRFKFNVETNEFEAV